MQQLLSSRRNWRLTFDDLLIIQLLSIEELVGLRVRAQGGSLQDTPQRRRGARPRTNNSRHVCAAGLSRTLCGPPDRQATEASKPTVNLPESSLLWAPLSPATSPRLSLLRQSGNRRYAFDGHGTRSTPVGAIDVAAGDEPLSILGANDEAPFLRAGTTTTHLSAIEQICGMPCRACPSLPVSQRRNRQAAALFPSSPRRVSPPLRASRSIHCKNRGDDNGTGTQTRNKLFFLNPQIARKFQSTSGRSFIFL